MVGTWLKDTNIVPKEALIEHFQNKSSCLAMPSSDSGEMDVSSDSSDADDSN